MNPTQNHYVEPELVETLKEGSYVAKIKRVPLFRGAHSFIFQIGHENASMPGTFRPMFEKDSLSQSSKAVVLREDIATIVCSLIQQAQARIIQLAEEELAWRQDEAIQRDEKKANFGKPITRVTGKTEKKKAKLAARTVGA